MKVMLLIFLLLFNSILFFENSYGQSNNLILITSSPDMEKIIFDGKWTFFSEWKLSSLTKTSLDEKQVILRTAHFENFIYVFVDSINDFTLDKGSDKATICFDGKNNKNKIADKDDYCFSSTLGHKQGIVFQGGSVNSITGNFQNISNPEGFIAVSNISDENDRYTKIPHPSFEFKIPIDLIQRSDNYGFYLSVYDASSNTFYNFPKETTRENLLKIPSPSQWGDILSPDKSLPEFNFPLLVFAIMIFSLIIFKSQNSIRNSIHIF